MATRDEIEHYLIQTGHPFETIDNNTWVVRDAANIVISYASPLVIFRAKLMDLPQHHRDQIARRCA